MSEFVVTGPMTVDVKQGCVVVELNVNDEQFARLVMGCEMATEERPFGLCLNCVNAHGHTVTIASRIAGPHQRG